MKLTIEVAHVHPSVQNVTVVHCVTRWYVGAVVENMKISIAMLSEGIKHPKSAV